MFSRSKSHVISVCLNCFSIYDPIQPKNISSHPTPRLSSNPAPTSSRHWHLMRLTFGDTWRQTTESKLRQICWLNRSRKSIVKRFGKNNIYNPRFSVFRRFTCILSEILGSPQLKVLEEGRLALQLANNLFTAGLQALYCAVDWTWRIQTTVHHPQKNMINFMYLARSQPILVFEVLENAKDNQLNIWHHLKQQIQNSGHFLGDSQAQGLSHPKPYLLPMARLAHLPSSKSLDLPDFPPIKTTILSKQKPFIYIYIYIKNLWTSLFLCVLNRSRVGRSSFTAGFWEPKNHTSWSFGPFLPS